MSERIVVIGSGNLGSAILAGLVRQGRKPVSCDTDPVKLAAMTKLGISIESSPAKAAAGATAIVLAVKPPGILPLLKEIESVIGDSTVVVSVAAGISLDQMRSVSGAPLVRAIPNLASTLGFGVTGVHSESDEAAAIAESIFSAVGAVVRLESEVQIDVVTAIGASGPAWVAQIVDSFVAAGVGEGLAPEVAKTVAVEMLFGTAHLLRKEAPESLISRVKTPGGTTAAGLDAFAERDIQGGIAAMVRAAIRRAAEIRAKG